MDRDLQAILLRDNPWLLEASRLEGWLAARVPERYQHRRAAEKAWQRWGANDRGAALESWVFTELWKALPEGATLHFWRSTSGAEVDFVLTRPRPVGHLPPTGVEA